MTGGYSGLGIETVRALTAAGVSVIVPARRVEVAEAALDDVPDLVIDVAGIMATPFQLTPQSWESRFGTNHLGHFALIGGVADLLSEGARVVSYSSVGHYRSPVLFDDLNFESTSYETPG